MGLSIIVAKARNGVIGKDNKLIWHLPDDLRFFKSKTSGHAIIMGRKTWESVGRPLPNRTNIVVSRDPKFTAAGCIVEQTLQNALAHCNPKEENFIVGGAKIYTLALPLVDKMYITEIDADFEGDTYFPEFQKDDWNMTAREEHQADDKHSCSFAIVTYEKKMAGFL